MVVSGEVEAVEELIAALRSRPVFGPGASRSIMRRIRRRWSAIGEPLSTALAGIEPRSSAITFISTVTGEVVDTAGLDARYWYRGIRQTVQFEQAVRAAGEQGYRVFVEASPHPVLLAGIEETLTDARCRRCGGVPTLGRDEGGLGRFLSVGGSAHVGAGWGWIGAAVFAGSGARRVELPTYAFQRRRFWLAPGVGSGSGDAARFGVGWGRACVVGCGGRAARFRRGGVDRAVVVERLNRGWPITRWPGWCCSPGRVLWSWRSAPAMRSAARWCRSWCSAAPLGDTRRGRGAGAGGRRRC